MRLPVRRFMSLPPALLRTIAGPTCTASESTCLITMQESNDLWHAAHASDGRIYDAIALRHWLNSQTNRYVIAGCPIDFVHVSPMPWILCKKSLHAAMRLTRCMLMHGRVWQANVIGALRRRMRRRRTSSFLRIVGYHAQVHRATRFRGRRAFSHDPSSPFVDVARSSD